MSAYAEMYGGSPQPTSPHSPTQSSEKSVKSCYAVVYELKNRKWAVSGEGGWSEVHLCKDYADSSHRILAWTVKNQNVLMNCNVTGECSYKEKSKNFHSFTDENGSRFGLGFHKSDSGLRQASHFLGAVVGVIKESSGQMGQFQLSQNNNPPPAPMSQAGSGIGGGGGGGGGPPPNPYSSHAAAQSSAYSSKPLPPTPKKNEANGYQAQNNIQSSYQSSIASAAAAPPLMSSAIAQEPPLFSAAQASQPAQQQHQPPPQPSYSQPPTMSSYQSPQQSYQSPHQQASHSPQPPQPPPAPMSNYSGQSGMGSPKPPQPPPNPYQKRTSSPPPQKQSHPPQPPPSMSSQLSKPQSPYQSTTDSVTYSPVQAAVSAPEQKHDDVLLTKSSQQQPPLMSGQKSPGFAEENVPNYHLKPTQTQSVPSKPIGQLGGLKILPPKPKKLQGGDKKILNPDKVEHTVRVVHDKDTGQYHGLPQEWMDALNQQFGVKPHELPSIKLDAYANKIPKVLITLRNQLEAANAYQTVGIFRLAPNALKNDQVKAQINKGNFDVTCDDVNVYANLLKVWFRDMPEPILNCVDPTMIETAQTDSEVDKVVSKFPEPQKSIFQWLCDMCCACAKFETVNKMGAGNLAIVIGPNLFNTDNFENPMKAMTFSGKVVQFFKLAIENRRKETGA